MADCGARAAVADHRLCRAGSPPSRIGLRLFAMASGDQALKAAMLRFEFRWLGGDSYERHALVGSGFSCTTGQRHYRWRGRSCGCKTATATIPIVALSGGDPVEAGLVSSLNRAEADLHWRCTVRLLAGGEALPILARSRARYEADRGAGRSDQSGPRPKPTRAKLPMRRRRPARICLLNALARLKSTSHFPQWFEQDASALLVMADPFLDDRREQIVALASYHDSRDLRMA